MRSPLTTKAPSPRRPRTTDAVSWRSVKVVCAPDSFKESLTAAAAAAAMAAGVRDAAADAEVDVCPIADGGEGTAATLAAATGGTLHAARVTGPLGEKVEARWAMLGGGAGGGAGGGQTACVEMAEASGLHLVPAGRRDPTRTTTYGTGELIRAALDAGAQRLLLAIGGSATCDGGCGMAQALGARFATAAGPLERPVVGGDLANLTAIDLSGLVSRLPPSFSRVARDALPPYAAGKRGASPAAKSRQVMVEVACDVDNPLTGGRGAAAVFGPQKGATAAQVEQLDAGLAHLAELLFAGPRRRPGQGRETARRSNIAETPGAGAAGGLGFGALVFLGATLRRGIDLVLDAVRFDARIRDADLCLTGEGRLDASTLHGKATLGVSRAAAMHGVPTIALVGSASPDADTTLAPAADGGFAGYRVIGQGFCSDESIRRTAELLRTAAATLIRGR